VGDPDDLAELVESLGYAVIPAQIPKVGDGNLGDDRKLRTERWLPPPRRRSRGHNVFAPGEHGGEEKEKSTVHGPVPVKGMGAPISHGMPASRVESG